MKTFHKKLTAVLLSAVMVMTCIPVIGTVTANAEETEESLPPTTYRMQDYIFSFAEDGIVIENYIGSKEDLTITSRIGSLPVVGIAEDAFREKGLKCVHIPETTTRIGEKAFAGNSDLAEVFMPGSVKRIESGAFEGTPKAVIYYCGTATALERAKVASDSVSGALRVKLHDPNSPVTTKATPDIDGSIITTCKICGDTIAKEVIAHPYGYKIIMDEDKDYVYNGKPYYAGIEVHDTNGNVIDPSNYTLAFSDNIKPGNAKINVSFKGDRYTGSRTVGFSIRKKTNPFTIKGKTVTVKYSKLKKDRVTVSKKKAWNIKNAKGTLSYTKETIGTNIRVGKDGSLLLRQRLPKGKYKVKVKVTDQGNWKFSKRRRYATVTVIVK